MQRFRTLPVAKAGAGFAPSSEVLAVARRHGAPVRYVDAYLAKVLGLSASAPSSRAQTDVRYSIEDRSAEGGQPDESSVASR